MRLSKPYFIVSIPYELHYKEKSKIRQAIKDSGWIEFLRDRYSTRAKAESVAARIKAALGLDLEVNEAQGLYL